MNQYKKNEFFNQNTGNCEKKVLCQLYEKYNNKTNKQLRCQKNQKFNYNNDKCEPKCKLHQKYNFQS